MSILKRLSRENIVLAILEYLLKSAKEETHNLNGIDLKVLKMIKLVQA